MTGCLLSIWENHSFFRFLVTYAIRKERRSFFMRFLQVAGELSLSEIYIVFVLVFKE